MNILQNTVDLSRTSVKDRMSPNMSQYRVNVDFSWTFISGHELESEVDSALGGERHSVEMQI